MAVTLNLKPEVEAGLAAQARAIGMTLEAYLQRLVEKDLLAESVETVQQEGSGMVWENGLFIYRTGRPLPGHVVDNAIRRSREERARHLLGSNF